ncbi:hypothetical protein BVY03_05325 [bacterium K02(2017)]|nr:hypothetical protein BVY03_05325 [bacterium K02(2017)]
MSQTNSQTQRQIRHILIICTVLTALSLLISFVYFNSLPFYTGLLAGSILGMANLVFITKIVVKMVDPNYKSKPNIALIFIIKLAFIGIILGLAFGYFQSDKMAFAAGYLCLIVSITLSQAMGAAMPVSKAN